MNRNCSSCNIKIDSNNYKKDRTVCNIKIDSNNYKKDRTVCKSCYKKKEEKTIITHYLQIQLLLLTTKKEKPINDKNRTLIVGVSNCGKSYLMNHILLQKQEPIFIITKSVNQCRNIKAQTSDEIPPLNKYENSTVVFDDMLL